MPTISEQVHRNAVALISLAVALASLGYNTWRNEQTEANRNVREAGFMIVEQLAELQQVVLFARFMPDDQRGDPRVGWAHILAAEDFSIPMPEDVRARTAALKSSWSQGFEHLADEDASYYEAIDREIDATKRTVLGEIADLD
jgi:hypothetical protein